MYNENWNVHRDHHIEIINRNKILPHTNVFIPKAVLEEIAEQIIKTYEYQYGTYIDKSDGNNDIYFNFEWAVYLVNH